MGLLRYQFDHYDTETIEAMKIIFGEDDVNELLFGKTKDEQSMASSYELELELRRK
jgi:hypothetical protein